MRKILKKNQYVVTMLAVLIAVAGYLNYADKIDSKKKLNNTDTYEAVYGEDDLISSKDDILSMDVDVAEMESESEIQTDVNEGETELEPGSAILTSSFTTGSFTVDARVNREQIRSKNKESLMDIINNDDITSEEKQAAVDEMVKMTERSELENTIETLLEAKGFSEVVVSLQDDQADVIIDTSQVSESDRAQIEDVITRKTSLPLDSIVITPMVSE